MLYNACVANLNLCLYAALPLPIYCDGVLIQDEYTPATESLGLRDWNMSALVGTYNIKLSQSLKIP